MVRKRSANKSESSEVLYRSNIIHQTDEHNHEMNTPEALTNTYKLFPISRLKLELRRKGLKTSGKKSTLVYYIFEIPSCVV